MTTIVSTHPAPLQRSTTSAWGRIWSYFVNSLVLALTNWAFLGFIIALPVLMYLFFSAIYGGEGPDVESHMMVTMATYGGLGSAISAGTQIQAERSTGWFRQLMLTALTPLQLFVTRFLVAVVVIVPPVVVVLVAGAFRGVDLPLSTWAAMLVISLIVLLPFVMMGLALGLWFKASTAQAASIFLMLGMAMLGGLWVPLELMPDFLTPFGRMLPSYWAAELTLLPLEGGPVPVQGVLVVVGWTVGLLVLGLLGYRRAMRNSRR